MSAHGLCSAGPWGRHAVTLHDAKFQLQVWMTHTYEGHLSAIVAGRCGFGC